MVYKDVPLIDQRGSVIISVLIIVMMLALFSTALLMISYQSFHHTIEGEQETKAYYMAEGGLVRAKVMMEEGNASLPSLQESQVLIDEQTFLQQPDFDGLAHRVEIKQTAPNRYLITSYGQVYAAKNPGSQPLEQRVLRMKAQQGTAFSPFAFSAFDYALVREEITLTDQQQGTVKIKGDQMTPQQLASFTMEHVVKEVNHQVKQSPEKIQMFQPGEGFTFQVQEPIIYIKSFQDELILNHVTIGTEQYPKLVILDLPPDSELHIKGQVELYGYLMLPSRVRIEGNGISPARLTVFGGIAADTIHIADDGELHVDYRSWNKGYRFQPQSLEETDAF